MKGIVLAGGSGTRLAPLTVAICKQLLPIYDKPMVYYPICTLMQAGIREIAIISTPNDVPLMKRLLGDGSQLGVQFSYFVQERPKGIAEAFLICADFIGRERCALILGDNLFFGAEMAEALRAAACRELGATMFAHHSGDPNQHGILEFDQKGAVTSLEEKPRKSRSRWAATGLYFYDDKVVEIAKGIMPSRRGELEITDVNLAYLAEGRLFAHRLGRRCLWYDAGTHASLKSASDLVQSTQEYSGSYIGCPEEVALKFGWVDRSQVLEISRNMKNSPYGEYLSKIANEEMEYSEGDEQYTLELALEEDWNI